MPTRPRPRVTAAAQRDLVDILRWTTKRLGVQQARDYQRTILAALSALARWRVAPTRREAA